MADVYDNSGTCQQEESKIKRTYDIVESMFDQTINKNTILSVVQNCQVSETVEALLQISSTNNQMPRKEAADSQVLENVTATESSYAKQVKSTKQISRIAQPTAVVSGKASEQIPENLREIVGNHKNGFRNVIIMRGLPGSGKTCLARKIVDFTVGSQEYAKYICSADDFFIINGVYQYDISRLGSAHEKNQRRVARLLSEGLSPVIVDNTNMKIWEMYPYIKAGVENGYLLTVLTPDTPWAWKPSVLARKNSHNVSLYKLNIMLERFETLTNIDSLLKGMNIYYLPHMKPPVLRNFPLLLETPYSQSGPAIAHSSNEAYDICHTRNVKLIDTKPIDALSNAEELRRKALIDQKQKELDELERTTREWESGSDWDETENKTDLNNYLPKPPRSPESQAKKASLDITKLDWDAICNSVPAWNHDISIIEMSPPHPVVQLRDASTLVEDQYFFTSNIDTLNIKTLPACFRDINFNHIPKHTPIPHKVMLDKGTSTEDLNEFNKDDRHFVEFRRMFSHIPEVYLRDVYDTCCGDIYWAVEIILEGIDENQIEALENVNSQLDKNPDQESEEKLDTKAENVTIVEEPVAEKTQPIENIPSTSSAMQTGHNTTSFEDALKAKLHIEKNIVVGDEHYSEHCLKIRNIKRGMFNKNDELEKSPLQSQGNCEDDCSSDSSSDQEEYVNLNLSSEIITQLHNIFGAPQDIKYADHIVPVISAPKSLLSQLNALWMESLAHQTEMQTEYYKVILKEDAELARKLAKQEEELLKEDEEPESIDLKEIMNLEAEINAHNESISQWKQKIPQDLAFKMTRDKLHRLFPAIADEVLVQILVAHDNNFHKTVEVLLTSTGQSDKLVGENAIDKFIVETEMAREKQIEKETQDRFQIEDCEWPAVGDTQAEIADVHNFRDQAQSHLNMRNKYHQKAKECFNRGMTQVASSYTQIAALHQNKYDLANHMAATSLIQVHAATTSNETIDLHFMYVPEALQVLDMFLDYHIQMAKEDTKREKRSLFFITGRGLHSKGGPKVKPAVRRRLRQRGFVVHEVNPGLLTTVLTPEHKFQHELR